MRLKQNVDFKILPVVSEFLISDNTAQWSIVNPVQIYTPQMSEGARLLKMRSEMSSYDYNVKHKHLIDSLHLNRDFLNIFTKENSLASYKTLFISSRRKNYISFIP